MKKGRRNYRTPVVVEYLDATESNDFTPPDAEWKTLFMDRADIDSMKPEEQAVAQQLHDGASVKFYFRWSSAWQEAADMGYRLRIKRATTVYSVTGGVVNVDELNREAELMASRTAAGVPQ